MPAKALILGALAAGAAAIDFSHWSPAGPGDVRSPCPGLNSMANHAILPHNGKGLTVPMLVTAMEDTYNLTPELATFFAVAGLLTTHNPLSLSFNLDNLDLHDYIEHDASLSRQDFHLGGDDHSFSPDVFNFYLSHFAGLPNTTIPACARARFARVQNSSDSDPDFTYGPTLIALSYGETALYLEALGNGGSNVPLNWVTSFFAHEKLPYNQGWRTSSSPIGFVSLNYIIPRLLLDSGEQLPEGLIITKTVLAKAILGLDPLSNNIPPLVQSLLNKYGVGNIL
jgi:Peroxidase, family 2